MTESIADYLTRCANACHERATDGAPGADYWQTMGDTHQAAAAEVSAQEPGIGD